MIAPFEPIRRPLWHRSNVVPVAIATVLLFWSGAATPSWAQRVLVDRVRIVVDNAIMTTREVSAYRDLRRQQIMSQFQGQALQEQLAGLDQAVMDELIERLLLVNRARDLDIGVSDDELDQRIDAIQRRDPEGAQLYSEAQLKEFVLKEILTRRVLQQEVYSRVIVRDEQIEAACRDTNQAGREIDVGHILIRGHDADALVQIEAIRRRLVEGADFEAVAAEVSQDPSVQRNQGRLGFIARGQFVKPFEEAAFQLAVGSISKPVETQFGYHIIKVFGERATERLNCQRLDAETRNRFEEQLFAQARARALDDYLKRLREEAEIRVIDR